MLDNGKIKISVMGEFPLIEVYHDGDIEPTDLEWAKHAVLHELTPPPRMPIDVIIDRNASYSLVPEAWVMMETIMQEAGNVAYVVHTAMQESMVELARNSYLRGKKVASFYSVGQAHAWLARNHNHFGEAHYAT